MSVTINRQRGISITEMILGVALFSLMSAGMMKMVAQAHSDMRAKNTAESMQSVAHAASTYYLENKAGIVQATTDGTNASTYCQLGVDPATGTGGAVANNTTKHTCAIDVAWLKWKGQLPSSFSSINPHFQKWTAIFRQVYSAGLPTGAVEMLTVGAVNGGNELSLQPPEILTAAEIAGGNGGFIPDKDRVTCKWDPVSTTYDACGVHGGWKVNVADFVNTP